MSDQPLVDELHYRSVEWTFLVQLERCPIVMAGKRRLSVPEVTNLYQNGHTGTVFRGDVLLGMKGLSTNSLRQPASRIATPPTMPSYAGVF